MRIITRKTGLSGKTPGTDRDSQASLVRLRAAETALDGGLPGDGDTLISFLINGLYLFGGQTVAAGGAPAEVTAELTRLGHRVRAFAPGEGVRGAGSAQGKRSSPRDRDAGVDRIFLGGTFGRGADHLERLRGLRKALRPGGLLAFHAIDRDRAWERTGERSVAGEGFDARVRVTFEPVDGRLTARVIEGAAPGGAGTEPSWSPLPSGPATGIQTWNLGELRALVQAAGLEWERAYGGWDGGAPGETGRLIVVAARPRRRSRPFHPPWRPGPGG